MNRKQLLDLRNADAARKLIHRGEGDRLTLGLFDGVTLPGAIHFYSSISHQSGNIDHIWREIEAKSFFEDHLGCLHATWTGQRQQSHDHYKGNSSVDFFLLNKREMTEIPDSYGALCFSEFRQCFVRASNAAGFPPRYLQALAAVIHEMADNVIQHSGSVGLVGFHATDGYLSFAISDLGKGVLTSLRSSSQWVSLANDEQALKAIVYEGASRKDERLGGGEGFKQLFKSLIDHNASIQIRTGSATVRLTPEPGTRDAAFFGSTPLPGVQVSFVCRLGGEPTEKRMEQLD